MDHPHCGGAGDSTTKVVFLTSATYDGNLGGVAGADAECQALADAAGLSGIFLAWLSDDLGSSPSTTFIRSEEPYVRVDDVKVAANWADLTDGTILHPIEADEQGGRPRSAGPGAIIEVWTGTDGDGTLRSAGQTCNDWFSTSDVLRGLRGNSTRSHEGNPGDPVWTVWSASPGCNLPFRLFCFEN